MTVSDAPAATRTAPAPVPPGHPGAPRMLHHVTHVTYDSARTAEFYTTVMGMPLVSVAMDDHLPSTGTRTPYFHTFFRMGDGSTIAFFESPGLPPAPEYPEPAFDNFNHLALEVPSKADVDAWRRWLESHGVEVLLVDHKIIYSIYFHDPNGVRLEITTSVEPTWNQEETAAAAALAQWVETKERAHAEGADPDERLRELITRNAHQARIRRERNATDPVAGTDK